MPGIMTPRRIRSGRAYAATSKAVVPLEATRTLYPSRSRAPTKTSRLAGTSSTTRILLSFKSRSIIRIVGSVRSEGASLSVDLTQHGTDGRHIEAPSESGKMIGQSLFFRAQRFELADVSL